VIRREFITLLGGAAAAWPLAARAQQPAKQPTIGYLGSSTALTQGQWTAAFSQRLRELGWIEGRNIAIEYRWAELPMRHVGSCCRSRHCNVTAGVEGTTDMSRTCRYGRVSPLCDIDGGEILQRSSLLRMLVLARKHGEKP
jgi:hypothetical protein